LSRSISYFRSTIRSSLVIEENKRRKQNENKRERNERGEGEKKEELSFFIYFKKTFPSSSRRTNQRRSNSATDSLIDEILTGISWLLRSIDAVVMDLDKAALFSRIKSERFHITFDVAKVTLRSF